MSDAAAFAPRDGECARPRRGIQLAAASRHAESAAGCRALALEHRPMRTPQQKLAHGDLPRSHRSRDLSDTAADLAVRLRENADALFGDAPDGITLQLGGRIVYANRRMAELVGHSDSDPLLGVVSPHL